MSECKLIGGPMNGMVVRVSHYQGEIRMPCAPRFNTSAVFAEDATIPLTMPMIQELIYVIHDTRDRAHFSADRSGPCGCGLPWDRIEDIPAHMEAVHGNESFMAHERLLRIKRAYDDYAAQKPRT